MASIFRNIKSATVRIILLAFSASVITPLSSFAADFKVYDGIKSKNKPNLSQVGILPLQVLYSASLWDSGESREEPDLLNVKSVAGTLNPSVPVCVDIEHWPTKGRPELVSTTIDKLKRVISTIRSSLPNAKIGLYSTLPICDYGRALGTKGIKRRDEWLRENLQLKPLSHSVDMVFPSLYTYFDRPQEWQRYAIENIKEARKYGKPVYVFLWPMFTDTSALKGQFIPRDFWRLQLETCRQYADGVVIWDKSTTTWNESAPWWQETLSFLKQR